MSGLQTIPLLYSYVIPCCIYSKLPEGFLKCNRRQPDFSECLTKAVENALRQLNKPIEEYGLYIEPLEIPPFSVVAKKTTAAFHQKYKSYKMYGFSVVNSCSKVEMDFTTNNLTIECTFPEIMTLAEYHYEGKLFDLNFNTSGAASEVMINLKVYLSFILGEYERYGQIYYKVNTHKLQMDPELIENTKLGNIVSGNRLLSRKVNEAFNKNWKLLLADVKADYERPIGYRIVAIFNNLLQNVPVSEMFDDY